MSVLSVIEEKAIINVNSVIISMINAHIRPY